MNSSFTQDDVRFLLKDKYNLTDGAVAPVGLEDDLERLKTGEPLAYVIGWTPFLGCHIDLSFKPLIPRPETELWVEKVIQEVEEKQAPLRVLDLCCGSGCIGIAVAKHLPQSMIDFVDINPSAIEQTEINIGKNAIEEQRTKTYLSDLFSDVPKVEYDLILANPPYVDPFGEFSHDLRFEPEQSLFAQKNGLALIERIISDSKKYLKMGGKLVLEFGKGQESEVERMLKEEGWKQCIFGKDQYDVVRYVSASHSLR
jgi:release factor-specific protein-(glutamine-N5) methyltransferase